MNISTLAKVLGVSIKELRDTGIKNGIKGFNGRNTRIPYDSALKATEILRPDKAKKLKDDDKIYLAATLTVAELAEAIAKAPGIVVRSLMMNGVMVTLNEKIDFDTAALISEELNVKVYPEEGNMVTANDEIDPSKNLFENNSEGKMVDRSPIITVMGHVDHGKTTLLDTIRKTDVVGAEAGAITQHISSYQIKHNDKKITFIDTPGHEAFTAMRARGTQLADFIILMVSATEGVKPQTVEVIERAKLSKTPIIVALNKIDLPAADIEKTKNDVSAFGLVPEEWGGETPYIPVSAKTGDGVDKLLDTIILMSDVAELKGQVECQAEAVIIESHKDAHKGTAAVVLVIKDSISVGDTVAFGEHTGKVRTVTDSKGKSIQTADICQPVEITGLGAVASTGDIMKVYKSKKDAENAASVIKLKNSQRRVYHSKSREGTEGDINVILKADVKGSLEALKESIVKIPQDKVKIIIKTESIGSITENDVEFAKTAGATILAFHTEMNSAIETKIEREDIGLIKSDIIYEILEWLEEQIIANTKHEVRIDVLGKAEVLAVFKSEKNDIQVFGGEVKEGKILSSKEVRVFRGETELGKFEIVELQKQKSKVKEVNINQQFGISIKGKKKIEIGDIVESIDEIIIK